jgi:hypothetical protein
LVEVAAAAVKLWQVWHLWQSMAIGLEVLPLTFNYQITNLLNYPILSSGNAALITRLIRA